MLACVIFGCMVTSCKDEVQDHERHWEQVKEVCVERLKKIHHPDTLINDWDSDRTSVYYNMMIEANPVNIIINPEIADIYKKGNIYHLVLKNNYDFVYVDAEITRPQHEKISELTGYAVGPTNSVFIIKIDSLRRVNNLIDSYNDESGAIFDENEVFKFYGRVIEYEIFP